MIVDDEQKDAARGIDPRYDPQFQRGYRPQPGERAKTRLRAAPGPSVATDESEDEERRPVEAAALSVAPVDVQRVTPAAQLPTAAEPDIDRVYATPAPPAAAAAGILDRLDLSPRRNPLMLALWLVSGGFVVLGIVLYSVSVSLSYTGSTPRPMSARS
ncbi:hypothetical protein ACRAWC_11140 [Leifsonia sp. L25]|uniref:hypothetical protein n=1 Tax=Actinomycetes TaxID=1760 RepID=UPI003D686246